MAKKCLVIGADTLSRTVDSNDRDSMIFADGAGASIIKESSKVEGFYHTKLYTCRKRSPISFADRSYNPESESKLNILK